MAFLCVVEAVQPYVDADPQNLADGQPLFSMAFHELHGSIIVVRFQAHEPPRPELSPEEWLSHVLNLNSVCRFVKGGVDKRSKGRYIWMEATMFTYEQSTGLLAQDGKRLAIGYAGSGVGKNNPLYEMIHDVGPIPRGLYDIGRPFNSDDHGPVVLPLTPRHAAFGRSGFLIHGNGVTNPGEASHGCIILDRPTREIIAVGEDRQLFVV